MDESYRRGDLERRLIARSRDPICVWELDGSIVSWNSGSEELYGYRREEALGQRKEQLLKTTVPSSSLDELRSTLLNKGGWTGVLRHIDESSRALNVETHLQLEVLDGRPLVLETVRGAAERET
jgi:two-component system CheB/CheR fusion protein